jgi:hypothetical protein
MQVLPGPAELTAQLKAAILERRPNVTWILTDADAEAWR